MKPILATTLSGLFLSEDPWKQAHNLWWDLMAEKLDDKSILEWRPRKDYFKGVDLVMQRLYPKLSNGERTRKARELFFDSVRDYIKQHPDIARKDVIGFFRILKQKYSLALVSATSEEHIDEILKLLGMQDLFDHIYLSRLEEKDDKAAVLERFVKEQGKPKAYIGTGRPETMAFCRAEGIPYRLIDPSSGILAQLEKLF